MDSSGDQISKESQEKINAIVSEFLGKKSTVTEIVPPQSGRSRHEDQYRLTVDNKRHISVKRPYGKSQDAGNESHPDIRWEMFHSDMRQLLGLPHYKLERKNGFPIPGWENKECIIMDWGVAYRRQNVTESGVRAEIRREPTSPIQMGQVAAQDTLFATGDRKGEHVIWDRDEKVAFSIDHEIPATDIESVTSVLQYLLGRIYGEKWHKGSEQQAAFRGAFGRVWERADCSKTEIKKFYGKETLDGFSDGFSQRLSMGHEYFLQKLLPQPSYMS